MARVGEEFPLACPTCGGDIRLIAFITDPGPIRKILTHLGEPLEPPPLSPARGPPTDWGEFVQVHDDRAIFQGRIDELSVIDRAITESCVRRGKEKGGVSCCDLFTNSSPRRAERIRHPCEVLRFAVQKDSPVNGTSAPVFGLMSDS